MKSMRLEKLAFLILNTATAIEALALDQCKWPQDCAEALHPRELPTVNHSSASTETHTIVKGNLTFVFQPKPITIASHARSNTSLGTGHHEAPGRHHLVRRVGELPPGWDERVDTNGRTYYYNMYTYEATWNEPEQPAEVGQEPGGLPQNRRRRGTRDTVLGQDGEWRNRHVFMYGDNQAFVGSSCCSF
jgi:hypothetical protein